jgi:hypothetical protein
LPVRLAFAVVEREVVMARKRSLWSELQRERERRARAAWARERARQQMVLVRRSEAHYAPARRACRACRIGMRKSWAGPGERLQRDRLLLRISGGLP